MQESESAFEKAKVHFFLALDYISKENWIAAEKELKKSLVHVPNRVSTLINLCATLVKAKKFQEAKDFIEKAKSLDPDNPELILNQGLLLFEEKRPNEALASYQRLIELKPDYADAWNNRGLVLNDLNLHEDALASCDKSIELKPDFAEAWSNRGIVLGDLKRYDEALASFDRSIALKPQYAEAWSNRGIVLGYLKRFNDALTSFDRSIELNPDYAEAWNNRGLALSNLKSHEDAVASYDKAIELKSDYAEAWSNRGIALSGLKRYDDALVSFDKSIEFNPEYAEAIYNKGLLQLFRKEFLIGFQNYVWRWKTKNFPSPYIKSMLPRTTRESRVGNVLLWAEQGLGDEIFYAGMLSQAREKFSNISLSADTRLHSIFRRSFPTLTLIDREQIKLANFDSGFDSQLPIGDLGYLLSLNEQEIRASRKPFFTPDSKKTVDFRLSSPFTHQKIVCGLAWSSSNKQFGKEKSVELSQFEPILKNPKLEFVNLQYGEIDLDIQAVQKNFDIKIHQIKNLDVLNDIDSLLALIDACDIIITTSNVTAHLAGSIGKRGCVLVPFSQGRIWYWHQKDAFSFWYPSLKIFYQTDRYDWSDTIRQATKWIEEIL